MSVRYLQTASLNHVFIATDKHCTMFYSTSYSKFQRICEGAMCKCVEGKSSFSIFKLHGVKADRGRHLANMLSLGTTTPSVSFLLVCNLDAGG